MYDRDAVLQNIFEHVYVHPLAGAALFFGGVDTGVRRAVNDHIWRLVDQKFVDGWKIQQIELTVIRCQKSGFVRLERVFERIPEKSTTTRQKYPHVCDTGLALFFGESKFWRTKTLRNPESFAFCDKPRSVVDHHFSERRQILTRVISGTRVWTQLWQHHHSSTLGHPPLRREGLPAHIT